MIVTREEAEFLLRHLNHYLVTPFQLSDIVSAMAGLRPLVQSRSSRDTKKLIRDYEIEIEPQNGLISVLGGKWTVYRAMAEDAINVVQKVLTGRITDSRTRDHSLLGAEDKFAYDENPPDGYRVRRSTMHHLTDKFGSFRDQVLDLAREDMSLLLPIVDGAPQIQAEAVYCIREELALSIEDILARRLGLQFYDWRLAMQAAPVVGKILARERGWSPARTREEVAAYVERINRYLEALGIKPVRAA
jgi:glycerol-3-phosphate dehydrogenase